MLELTRSDQELSGAGAILLRLFNVLDREDIPYCVLHGYEAYPADVPSDVDCVMPAEVLPFRLARLLEANKDAIGAELVQWRDEASHYFVLAGKDTSGLPTFLQIDVCSDYTLGYCTTYSASEILESRRRYRQFWVPAAHIEFGCSLVRRMGKGALDAAHQRWLTDLYRQDPARCDREVARFWGAASMAMIVAAAGSGNWDEVQRHLYRLRAEMLQRLVRRQLRQVIAGWLRHQFRRARRLVRPMHGLHVTVLGPDGAGKSSVLEAVRRQLAPAFFATSYRFFAPSVFRRAAPAAPNIDPQGKPQRSVWGSVAKAIYWWFDYTIGYYLTVQPERARATLALFDRYLVDALADPKRCRYGGPTWLVQLVWHLVPKPDLVVLLDAPVAVIQSRKQEVPPAETARQREAYRSIVEKIPQGYIVDAGRPLAQVVADVTALVLRYMAARTAQHLHLERER